MYHQYCIDCLKPLVWSLATRRWPACQWMAVTSHLINQCRGNTTSGLELGQHIRPMHIRPMNYQLGYLTWLQWGILCFNSTGRHQLLSCVTIPFALVRRPDACPEPALVAWNPKQMFRVLHNASYIWTFHGKVKFPPALCIRVDPHQHTRRLRRHSACHPAVI